MPDNQRSHLILIGGRAGVGKSSVAAEMHAILSENEVRHAVIEGDALDLAWPPPWEHSLAERNLADMWRNYRELGYGRLVYTNTVSVLQQHELAGAMGNDPLVTSILLSCSDTSAERRLSQREMGGQLQSHLVRSIAKATELERMAPESVIRIPTDNRSISAIANDILIIAGWRSADEDNETYD